MKCSVPAPYGSLGPELTTRLRMDMAAPADRSLEAAAAQAQEPLLYRARRRQVALRVALLVAAYVYWGLLVLLWFVSHGGTGTVVGNGGPVLQNAQTLYEVNPGPVIAILGGTLVTLLVATGSLAWRVARRCARTGVSAMGAAVLVGVVSVLGILTVGPVLVPLGVLLVLVALPLNLLGDAQLPRKVLDSGGC